MIGEAHETPLEVLLEHPELGQALHIHFDVSRGTLRVPKFSRVVKVFVLRTFEDQIGLHSRNSIS